MIDINETLGYLASEYFSYMLNNRIRLREYVGKFQQITTKPRNNIDDVVALCEEFNNFRMKPILDQAMKTLDEEQLDRLDGALLGKLVGFSPDIVTQHQVYEAMRSEIEKPIYHHNGPVLLRGLVVNPTSKASH
jgi:hypothetical protein